MADLQLGRDAHLNLEINNPAGDVRAVSINIVAVIDVDSGQTTKNSISSFSQLVDGRVSLTSIPEGRFVTGYAITNLEIEFNSGNSINIIEFNDINIEADGALFIPFDPIDFKNTKNPNNMKVKLELDLDNIIKSEQDGIYMLNDDADGTPYYSDIRIIED